MKSIRAWPELLMNVASGGQNRDRPLNHRLPSWSLLWAGPGPRGDDPRRFADGDANLRPRSAIPRQSTFLSARRNICWLVVCGVLAGCIHAIDDPPADPVSITSVVLQQLTPTEASEDDQQRNPEWRLVMEFDSWLALREQVSSSAVVLKLDGVDIPARTTWRPVERALHTSFRAPRSGALEVRLDPERLPAIDGRRLIPEDIVLRLQDAPTISTPLPEPEVSFARDLQGALDASCGPCHGPDGQLPALSPPTLVNVPSRHVQGRALVEPGEPARSIALLLVINGYPIPEGRRKPPIWADPPPPPLPDRFASDFARWISEGALR